MSHESLFEEFKESLGHEVSKSFTEARQQNDTFAECECGCGNSGTAEEMFYDPERNMIFLSMEHQKRWAEKLS